MNKLEKKLLQWRDNPLKFVKECLKAEYMAPWQIEALKEMATGDRLSIRSGHGVGKSTFLSWLILWWLTTRDNAKIPCVAPTQHQLDDVLWTECRMWHRRMEPAFKNQLDFSSDRIFVVKKPKESFAAARTARRENPEALQGFHSGNLLFLFDEASGIDDLIFETGRGALSTPGSKVVMTGNPTRLEGYFFDSHHRNRSRWKTMRVNFEDVAEAPYTDLRFAREIEDEFGRDSNVFRVRVLGDFPTQEEDSVIPLDLIEAAVTRDIRGTGQMIWGVDVARFGDDRSTLCKRRGNKVVGKIKWWSGKDNMQLAGLISKEYEDAKPEERPEWIMVDVIGYGAGVVDRLRETGLPARGINVAESAYVDEKYMRLRDELWFRGRDFFEARDCSFPDDQLSIGELSTVLYDITSTGKFKVESKEERKKRLTGRVTGRGSPDFADAFIMTFAAPSRPRFSRKSAKDPNANLKVRAWV